MEKKKEKERWVDFLSKNLIKSTSIAFGEPSDPGYIKYEYDSKGKLTAVSHHQHDYVKEYVAKEK